MSGGASRISATADERPAQRPAWLITVDTEGDDLWSAPRHIRTENARHLPRFQSLCEKFRLRPTYLVSWEMACCPVFRDFARDLLARNAGEIGMHLHAWNSPPIVPLTDDDYRWRPYLIEYPRDVMREKIHVLTDTLRETFSTPIVSHRAGRWAFDRTYAHLLIEQGYLVDCSMTPGVSWRHERGTPGGAGGVDYRAAPREAFWMDEDDVRRPGRLPLLEVPVTIRPGSGRWLPGAARRLRGRTSWGNRAVERVFPSVHWFRPNRHNRRAMLQILRTEKRSRAEYLELMLHSSELMPGGSPYFPDRNAVERLYDTLEAVFSAGADDFRGMTLAEYHARHVRARGEPASRRSPATAREPRHAECMEA